MWTVVIFLASGNTMRIDCEAQKASEIVERVQHGKNAVRVCESGKRHVAVPVGSAVAAYALSPQECDQDNDMRSVVHTNPAGEVI
ncbi:hypothetical protein FHX42_005264 [Saccharopolyspora lacisalsi]|uniref:Uncharacterized protein n=1 Tax=Halosaccharopolyspora lacisalsi TaxID=1000566 RepID=A0A839E834_9PSEU|nr:hypothetical protein [Halosaccharopolyspora lacisalsi]MBA8827857.1 hypothetical protein [Halosaccharopolyspora lacisalsi]